MVNGSQTVSGSVDLLSVGNKMAVKTSKAKKSGEGDFKSMLDQNAQSTQNTQGTQNTQNAQNTQNTDAAKTDAAEKEQPVENVVPKEEETMDENGMELEVLAQFVVIPEQERAALNWAEEIPEDVAPEMAVERVGEAAAAAPEALVQADTQATLTKDEAGLSVRNRDEEGDAEAVNAADKQDAGEGRQADGVQEGKVQKVVDTKQGDAAEDTGAKAWAEDTGDAQEETKVTEDVAAHAAPKAAQEDDLVQFKVGDAVKISEPQAAENMADTILVRAGENNREFEMQLNPEELGTVKIKMVFQEGKIHIAMTCDNQRAMDLLSSTSSKLKELIEERTGSEVSVQVEQESETPYHEQEKQNGREDARQDANHKQNAKGGAEPMDFIQQLRLGLVEAE